jgi:NAD(P)-dependent dehydrogenase (short-subunit alcohol dehydrogenase family)
MTNLSNKTILVTGGSTGIGRATSLVLASEGARIIVADIQDEEGSNTVGLVKAAGGHAEYHHVDVSEYEQVDALIKNIAQQHGRLDGAFNNAGIEGPTAKIHDVLIEEWDRVIRVNLTGVFVCMKAEIEQLLRQEGGGSIVNTASVAGLIGIPGAASYNAAKHGVIGLTKTVALEYGSRNIRVNAVCPGFIETPMLERVSDASTKIKNQLMNTVPMKRIAKPSEIGDTVAWLLSDKSSYVTGISVPVDGGWTSQ